MCKFRDFNKYEVFNDGKIYSYKSNKFLKPQTDNKGYQRVGLYDNEGNMKWYQLHRVVYEAVSGEPIPNHLEVNHISEDKMDNSFSNLELLSHKDNVNFGTRTERARKSISKALTNNPKRSKLVGAFQNGELVMTFPSTMEAQRNGFNSAHISACCRNRFNREGNNVYKGFEWRYI